MGMLTSSIPLMGMRTRTDASSVWYPPLMSANLYIDIYVSL
jgi:hypothetical protein